MSQSRVRKAPNGGENCKNRASAVKASGDSVPSTRPEEQNQRSRSKTKIPKSIRYDLENALVSLCDVWFEEIKPHLIRNNIKVHVDGSGGPANGDHHHLSAAIDAPGCAHHDPGAAFDRRLPVSASSACCCPTRLTASRARCRRPALPPRPAQRPHPPSSLQTAAISRGFICQNKFRKGEKSPRYFQTQVNSFREHNIPAWQVPRLSRTQTTLALTSSHRKVMNNTQAKKLIPVTPPSEDYIIPFLNSRSQRRTFNRSTQTDLSPVSHKVPYYSLGLKHRRKRNTLAFMINRATCTDTPTTSQTKTMIVANEDQTMVRPFIQRHRPAVPQNRPTLPSCQTCKTQSLMVDYRTRGVSPQKIDLISQIRSSGLGDIRPTSLIRTVAPVRMGSKPTKYGIASLINKPIATPNRVTSPLNLPSLLTRRAVSPLSRPPLPSPRLNQYTPSQNASTFVRNRPISSQHTGTSKQNSGITTLTRPTSPLNRPSSLLTKTRSRLNDSKSSLKKLTSPRDRPTSLLNRSRTSPLNSPKYSQNSGKSTIDNLKSAQHKPTSLNRPTSPVNKAQSPPNRLTSPLKSGTSTLNKLIPTQNRPPSPLNMASSPLNIWKSSYSRPKSPNSRPKLNAEPSSLSTRASQDKPLSVVKRPTSPLRSLSPQTAPMSCRANTALHASSNKERQANSAPKRDNRRKTNVDKVNKKMSSLFDLDLINIIGETNDKRLNLLYACPNREDSCASTMMLCPANEKNYRSVPKKIRPWR